MPKININGKSHILEHSDDDTPLLWYLRETLHLTGTKYGCGKGQCGACTVHFNGMPIRSCIVPISTLIDGNIVTIEGISSTSDTHPVQDAWVKLAVPQCGYCQSGQIMSAIALLEKVSNPSDDDINNAMSGNICRCGTYQRIKSAIHFVANHQGKKNGTNN